MAVLDKIIDSQDRILLTLALCESSIGELYVLYSEYLREMADFWLRIAEEEKRHADILEKVRTDLKQGELMRGLGHFGLDQVQERIAEARWSPPTSEQAVSIALAIESSIIDSRFFPFASSEGSEFQKAAHNLAHDTQDHISLVGNAKSALMKAGE